MFSIDTVTLWCWANTETGPLRVRDPQVQGPVIWLWVHHTYIIPSQGDSINYSNTIDIIIVLLYRKNSTTYCLLQIENVFISLILSKRLEHQLHTLNVNGSGMIAWFFFLCTHIPHTPLSNIFLLYAGLAFLGWPKTREYCNYFCVKLK